MLKGGYQIIDLGNRNFHHLVGITIPGIYDKIEGTRKPILLSGFKYADVEFKDMFVNFTVSGSNFVATVYPVFFDGANNYLNISVNSNDVVEVNFFD